MKITIRPEQPRDIAAISALHRAAFRGEGESQLVSRLRKSAYFIPELSLVGLQGDDLLGHILFSKVQIVDNDGREFETLALAPMAVTPAIQFSGIGSQLVRTGLDAARTLGYKSVVVLGHPTYYPRFGFVAASTWGITTSYKVPDEAFMALELMPGSLVGVSGRVIYPPEFSGL
ncbi:GNAT family N-acetyltransferase [Chitinophaga lutea]